jgi:hypothetical protein
VPSRGLEAALGLARPVTTRLPHLPVRRLPTLHESRHDLRDVGQLWGAFSEGCSHLIAARSNFGDSFSA